MTEQHRTARNGTEQHGTAQDSTGQCRTIQNDSGKGTMIEMEQPYITLKGQISVEFLKKRNFTGSYKEMRYNLFIKDGQLTAATYPQPYCWECTPEEQKTYQSFEATKEGMEEAIAWLNEAYEMKFSSFALTEKLY